MNKKSKTIGLALGGGGARGWFHIGVIKALRDANIPIDYVAGTSIGALIGGVYASGRLEELEQFALSLDLAKVIGLLDFSWAGKGLLAGEKVKTLLNRDFTKKMIKSTYIPFAAVATDLATGAEVHLVSGNLVDAIRASIAIPGIFSPVKRGSKYLLDGGVVNPMPVNVARQMGADIVIAVDLNTEMLSRRKVRRERQQPPRQEWLKQVHLKLRASKNKMQNWFSKKFYPTTVDIIGNTIYIVQHKITEENLRTFPADFLIRSKLGHIKLFDFHLASHMIDLGYREAKKMIPKLKKQLG